MSSRISFVRSSLSFAKAPALCFSSAVRANMRWTVSRSPTHRAKSRYFLPSREGGRPSASDPPHTINPSRRRRFEFVQWIRGIKASTGARSWRAHLRAFCGKPALAGTAHPSAHHEGSPRTFPRACRNALTQEFQPVHLN